MLSIGFPYTALIMFMYVPYIPDLKLLTWRGGEFCWRPFHHIMRWSCEYFLSICWYGGLCGLVFRYWAIPHPWDEAYLIIMDDSLDVFLNGVKVALKEMFKVLIYMGLQIKTTLRFHPKPNRMPKNKSSCDSTCWWVCRTRGTLPYCWWDCRLVQPLWETIWLFFRKLEYSSTWRISSTNLGIYPKYAPTFQRCMCSTMFIVALHVITGNNPDVPQ